MVALVYMQHFHHSSFSLSENALLCKANSYLHLLSVAFTLLHFAVTIGCSIGMVNPEEAHC